MPIDPSISDMTWLTQGGDAGKSLAQGAAVGAVIARSREAHASLAQRAQEFQQEQAVREKQLSVELAQAPLRQTLLQQQSQENALKIELGLKAKQDDIEATGAFTGLANRISPLLQTGKLNDAVVAHADAGLNNNVLLTDQRYQNLGKQLDVMQKEADLATFRKGTVDARMKAAEGSSFRSLPPGMKLQKLLDDANANLADALDPETGDATLAAHYQQQVNGIQSQLQMETDKLKVQQGKLVNDSARIQAQENRTKEIEKRTAGMDNRMRGDLASMKEKIKVIQDLPKSAMDQKAKFDAIDALHAEFEAKTKTYSTPSGSAPASDAPAASTPTTQFRLGATYRKPDGSRYIYKGGDANDATSWQPAP